VILSSGEISPRRSPRSRLEAGVENIEFSLPNGTNRLGDSPPTPSEGSQTMRVAAVQLNSQHDKDLNLKEGPAHSAFAVPAWSRA